jgi:hypothetical protein
MAVYSMAATKTLLRNMSPKRFPKLTYPKIFARNAAGQMISPTLAIVRIVRQTRPWVSAASAGRRQLRSTQTRKTDEPSTWPRNMNLASTGRDAASTRSSPTKYRMSDPRASVTGIVIE